MAKFGVTGMSDRKPRVSSATHVFVFPKSEEEKSGNAHFVKKGCVCLSELLFTFQEVDFYGECTAFCDGCTLNQRMTISHTLKFTSARNSFVFHFPAILKSLQLRTNSTAVCSVQIEWLASEKSELDNIQRDSHPHFLENRKGSMLNNFKSVKRRFMAVPTMRRAHTFAIKFLFPHNFDVVEKILNSKESAQFSCKFEEFEGFNLHCFVVEISSGIFSFLKYTNTSYSTTSEYLDFLEVDVNSTLEMVQKVFDKYPYPGCPVFYHHPKLVSWIAALEFCRNHQEQLPQFVTLKDQRNFLSVLGNPKFQTFGFEAVYLGVRKFSKVRVCSVNFCVLPQ